MIEHELYMKLIDWEGTILGPADIVRLAETPEGCRQLKEYFLSARIAYAVTNLLGYLDELKCFERALTPEEQQNLCNVMYWCLKKAPHEKIQEYIADVVAHFKGVDDFGCAGSA